MGIDVIRLNDPSGGNAQKSAVQDLPKLHFARYAVPQPAMSIWMMSVPGGRPLFPWWSYEAAIDEEIHRLNNLWSISTPQNLFDLLFLAFLRRAAGSNLYFLFPGNIRTEGWKNLPDSARATFERGQGCVYRLEGAYSSKLAVNWVPFFQNQSLARDPAFENMWRLFVAARTDDVANSLSFFSLKEPRRLPEVVKLLIEPNEERSERMADLVDWFGLYTSPINPSHGTAAVTYARSAASLNAFQSLQDRFAPVIDQVRAALAEDSRPASVLRVVSRLVAL